VESQILILSDVSRLEDERLAALTPLGLPGEESQGTRLETLIKEAPEREAQGLREVGASLRAVLEAIGSVNNHNGMLINQSLSYIDRTLKMIAGEDSSSTVYTSEGRVKSRTGQIAVDRKI
jgi:flagellar biosynthesis/type III secretory pathway chaperone